MKCIYCLKENALFTKVDHVIPQAFGKFKDNFTLINMVCDECNQYLGDNLEIHLARDTREGGYRFDFNIKDPKEFKTSGKNSRQVIKLDEGPFKGAYAFRKYSLEEGKITIAPVPQIGFRKKASEDYEYFTLEEIIQKKSINQDAFDLKHPEGIRMFACDYDQAGEILRNRGIDSKFGGEFDAPKDLASHLLCQVRYQVDDVIFRAIAKIAFNYLAYWEKADFVLKDGFNTIRQYIRYGQRPDYPLVVPSNNPILGDEPIEGKRRIGHIVTIDWAKDGVSIVAQVSLFNDLKYLICLSKDFSGEHREIQKGHFFNTAGKEILELGTSPGD